MLNRYQSLNGCLHKDDRLTGQIPLTSKQNLRQSCFGDRGL
jgi:hypothetical protein